jgi:hypothetical protein
VKKAQRALANAQAAMHNDGETERLAAALLEAEADAEASLAQAQISGGRAEVLKALYTDFERDAFAWLESDQPAALELVQDVVDTLRALRCADALRQRGTVLRTSGSYEVFVDQRSSHAVFALRLGDAQLFLLEVPERISAGEANMASSELDKSGNLRISFHHGAFSDPGAVLNAAYSAALVVNDIQADVVDSYHRAAGASQRVKKLPADIEILIELVDDNLEFAGLVCQQLLNLNPEAARHARVVPSLQVSSPLERTNYLRSDNVDWDLAQRQALLAKIEQFGHKTEGIDPDAGFTDVRLVKLRSGEKLIEAGAPSGFVYIPLGEGLRIVPLGGYQAFVVQPWMPVGVTGVIRGSIRNATVLAEKDMDLLAIPKDVFLKHWHHTYTPQEFARLFTVQEIE